MYNFTEMKKRLLELIKRDAVFRKKVKLSSGKVSNYYIDLRRITLSPEGVYFASHLIWRMIKDEDVTAIGGPTLGADALVGGVCLLAYNKKNLKGFIVRKEPKKHGRGNLIEGKDLTPRDRVVLIDDVATTGGSLVRALESLRNKKIKVVKALVIVDREEGAREVFLKLRCPFQSIFTKKDLGII